MEYRYCELRATSDAITGTLIRYGNRADIGGYFTEEFSADSIRYKDVIVNIMHDRSKPVARLGSSLSLDNRDNEIIAVINPPDSSYGRDVRAMVDAGILRGLSMEFRATREDWQDTHRIITQADLHGIGIVDSPAYSDSEIQKRWAEMHNIEQSPSAWGYYV